MLMDIYMPEIFWFDDRKAITCVDIQQTPWPVNRVREVQYHCDRYYKIATVSVSSDVRIWDFCFEIIKDSNVKPLKVDFVANLDGHMGAINCCKFSPNGQFLATGDAYGGLIMWYFCEDSPPPEPSADLELPPNKENWKQYRKGCLRHTSDVTCLAWSPCSNFLASASNDDSIMVQDVANGKTLWTLRNFRRFPVGLVWDPRGKYLLSFSTDRRLDIINAKRGHRIKNAFTVEHLNVSIDNVQTNPEASYKLFHDDQLVCFARTIDFSPCGSLLFVPTAHLELPGHNVYGTYVFRRKDLNKCQPRALLPSKKPTILVRCCPVVYELKGDKETNFLKLPYRVIFAVMTNESVTLYDSQHQSPFMYLNNLHYDNLTSLSWTPDGKAMAISSLEGYNTFTSIQCSKIGCQIDLPPWDGRDSPNLIKIRKKNKNTEEKSEPKKNLVKAKPETETPKRTAPAPKQASKSPKTPSLFKFFSPVNPKKEESPPIAEAAPQSMIMASKSKKKIETVLLEKGQVQ
uniref:Uncharacterized protein n=1 Tax=Panagrolaimus sp. JU765 TaxID=591449 RepID=A0AC34RL50_9BILA